MSNDLRFRATMDDKVSGTLGKMKDKFDLLGKSKGAQQILGGVGVGVGIKALGILQNSMSGVGDVIADSITAASDLAETQSKVGVVFGKSGKDIDAWGKGAAQSLGLSQQAAEEAAGSLGNLFTGIGQSQGEAAKMSKSVVTLASDLASFNNIDPTEALDKLRSGLAGESEPLRALGVFLSEAKVKAQAMKMGLGGAHGELTEGEKILARYQIILAETATAQGDFARTSDGLANSERIKNAKLKDSEALLGKRLLPLQQKVTDAEIDFATGIGRVLTASDKTSEGLTAHAEILQRLSLIVPFVGGTLKDTAKALYTEADAIDAANAANLEFAGSSEDARLAILAADAAVNGFSKDVGPAVSTAVVAMGPLDTKAQRINAQLLAIKQSQWGTAIHDEAKAAMGGGLLDSIAGLLHDIDAAVAAIEAGPHGGHSPGKKPRGAGQSGGIGGNAEGGWVGLNGPELSWLGETGPEFVLSPSMLRNGGGTGGGHGHDIYMDGHLVARAVSERHYGDYSRGSPSATRK